MPTPTLSRVRSRFYCIPGGRTVGMTLNRIEGEEEEEEGNDQERKEKRPRAQVPSGLLKRGGRRVPSPPLRSPAFLVSTLARSSPSLTVHAREFFSFECLPTLVGAFHRELRHSSTLLDYNICEIVYYQYGVQL